jgi:hypothetical protein
MDASHAAPSGLSLTASFEKLLFSGVRLSGAATLFGVAQLETALNDWQQGGGIGKQMDRFGATVDTLTQRLVNEMSPGKQDALNSIADITTKVVSQSFEATRFLDPRQLFRLAGNLTQRSAEKVVQEEPKLAADVLAS